jgi:hypothetical protein
MKSLMTLPRWPNLMYHLRASLMNVDCICGIAATPIVGAAEYVDSGDGGRTDAAGRTGFSPH